MSAVPWFPIVGVVVGAAVGGIAAGLWHVVPRRVAAAVAVLLGVLITGAFHEDGLADVADAFAGGWTVERRLQILEDPLPRLLRRRRAVRLDRAARRRRRLRSPRTDRR